MGVDRSGIEFLTSCVRDGIDFSSTLTLGRQELMVSRWEARRLGLDPSLSSEQFADRLFGLLGAKRLEAMDASDFEGASIVHDLNKPLGSRTLEPYSVVLDGGTLEHVFEITTALRSILQLVAVGGHFIAISPVNNEAGHGFFQLSPEFWFRVLSPVNGYRVKRMLLREMSGNRPWYKVADPAEVGSRAQFRTRRPTYLFILSERTFACPVLREAPFQSDYVSLWGDRLQARGTSSVRARALQAVRHNRRRLRYLAGRPIAEPFIRDSVYSLPSHFERIHDL